MGSFLLVYIDPVVQQAMGTQGLRFRYLLLVFLLPQTSAAATE